jgi:hypothetical protein
MHKKQKKSNNLLNNIDKSKDFLEKDIKVRWEEEKKYQNVKNNKKLSKNKNRKKSFFNLVYKRVNKHTNKDMNIINKTRIK